MRTLLVLTCCLALAGLVRAEPPDKASKKKHGDAAASEQQAAAKPGKRGGGQRKPTTQGNVPGAHANKQLKKQQKLETQGDLSAGQSNRQLKKQQKLESKGQLPAVQKTTQKAKVKQFNLSKTVNKDITKVTFKENNRIVGAENWRGEHYTAFRTYRSVWHDRGWWDHHHSRVVFILGGWYFWNSGWWYPAWGYDHSSVYVYDGPIYAYNDLPPDQVIANVQASLQEQGYYHGEVDGMLGPLTRAALADYQRDHGLYTTAAIDQPTLEALGFV